MMILVSAVATAGAMAVVGWALPGFDMAGPRPGTRIALLVPQLEVTVIFVLGLPFWSQGLAAERSPALRAALAATARGRLQAVTRGAAGRLLTVAEVLVGGAIAWIPVMLLSSGPSPASVLRTRLVIIAFAVFAVGLGLWLSGRCRGALAAAAAATSALVVMMATPFAIAPLLSTFGTHWLVVQAAVLVSPWVVAAGITGLDLVHMQWMYALSPLGHVELAYPGLLFATLAYGGAGVTLLLAAARALRPARTTLGGFR
jgi:hypothetical protein